MPVGKSAVEFRTDERVLVRVDGMWTTARYIRRQPDGSHFVHLNTTQAAVTVTDENIRKAEDG
jgi:hypothetical protein